MTQKRTSTQLLNKDIKTSRQFKFSVAIVTFSIALFFLFYVCLVIAATVVLYYAVELGIIFISSNFHFVTFLAGIGMLFFGIMIFIFVIKFMFASTLDNDLNKIEIQETDFPILFEFIKKVSKESKTRFPKKIYLIPDVNASVSFKASIWNLILPVKKELNIGLGLINTLNVSEFKSVIAHEFGHFSQKSMLLGNYIYTINKIIYNMAYGQDNWDRTLHHWMNIGGIPGLFGILTYWVSELINKLMRFIYGLININYLKLSREMEYHADLVAASISGNEVLINALRKITFSSFTYDYTINILESLAVEKKSVVNLYQNHTSITHEIANENNLINEKNEIVVTNQFLESQFHTSRINITDQWASHPTLKEREKNLSNFSVIVNINPLPAWELINNAERNQELFTKKLYSVGYPETEFEELKQEEYRQILEDKKSKFQISEKYNGFYDNRYLSDFQIENVAEETSHNYSFEEVYNTSVVELIRKVDYYRQDFDTLVNIRTKYINTAFFEFDGIKYKRKDAPQLIKTLNQEIKKLEKEIVQADINAFKLFLTLTKEAKKENEFLTRYTFLNSSTRLIKQAEKINRRFINFSLWLNTQLVVTDEDLDNKYGVELFSIEKDFKILISEIEKTELEKSFTSDELKNSINEYASSKNYITKSYNFEQAAAEYIIHFSENTYYELLEIYNQKIKEFTDFQLTIFKSLNKS